MTHVIAGPAEYLGLFLIALGTLMLEILLTRIFSVTMYSHLAFAAVSIAMFGMTVGGVIVYLAPRWFGEGRARAALAASAALFGVTAVWSVDLHLRLAVAAAGAVPPIVQLAVTYAMSAVPFVFSGIATAVALTKFSGRIGRLYAADLVGAAAGCVVLGAAFDRLGGPRASFAAAAAAAVAAIGFVVADSGRPARRRAAAVCGLVLAAAVTARFALPLEVRELGYMKGAGHERLLYEKWNSYSRIAVAPPEFGAPVGFGLSSTFTPTTLISQLRLNIDASAETALTAFDGDLRPLEFLKYDVTNLGHHVTRNGRVLVVGAGGGRDVLSALVFDQAGVVAVEMNEAIIGAVNGVFGDVTGHLDRHPKARFVNDEARSYLSRTDERFDLLQISLIDTWAATAAGAFVLTENTLYTVEAWRLFLTRLTAGGLLSVSRWYSLDAPGETYKTLALGTEALRRSGVSNPRAHMILAVGGRPASTAAGTPRVATLLVKRAPFTEAEVVAIEAVAARLAFEILISPHPAQHPAFIALTDAAAVDRFVASFPGDLRPPTDDRPFFFSMNGRLLQQLLLFVTVLTLAFVAIPVFVRSRPASPGDGTLTLVFAALGFAFMLVEIAQMQRLIVLLGHPAFSLSVVLFGMLLASGAGSAASGGSAEPSRWRLAALVALLLAAGAATPPVIGAFQGSTTPIRIAAALALLMPPAFFMGMMFPIAMRVAAAGPAGLTPWFWAINGATSVTASVLAVLISSRWGIAAAWNAGVACYAAAAVLLVLTARRFPRGAPASSR